MTTDLVKDFTKWMDEGFNGTYLHNDPSMSMQFTKRLLCGSGLSLSIQAGWTQYCHPRENSPTGSYSYYTEFEVGFPSEEIPELMEYAEYPEIPTETVYGYVPVEVIRKVIYNNGGVVGFVAKEINNV